MFIMNNILDSLIQWNKKFIDKHNNKMMKDNYEDKYNAIRL